MRVIYATLARYGLVVASLAALIRSPVLACTCPHGKDLTKEIDGYAVIFLGQMADDSSQTPGVIDAVFRVRQVWKGERTPSLTVRTSSHHETCGYPFVAGRFFVVFAHAEGPLLVTDACTLTKGSADSAELIHVLDRRFRKATTVPETPPAR